VIYLSTSLRSINVFHNNVIERLRYLFPFQLTEDTKDTLHITMLRKVTDNIPIKEMLSFTLNIFLTHCFGAYGFSENLSLD
jgi:hypothetical protein